MSAVSVSGAVQPFTGPSMIPNTRAPMPSADSTVPAGSSPTCSLALVAGTTRTIPTRVTNASAEVTQKIDV